MFLVCSLSQFLKCSVKITDSDSHSFPSHNSTGMHLHLYLHTPANTNRSQLRQLPKHGRPKPNKAVNPIRHH